MPTEVTLDRSQRSRGKDRKTALLGVGLDGDDGHKRITRGEGFLLLGGSHQTHERMQETAVKFSQRLADRGQPTTSLFRNPFTHPPTP